MNTILKVVILFLFLPVSGNIALAAKTYTCEQADGTRSFQDRPCSNKVLQIEERKPVKIRTQTVKKRTLTLWSDKKDCFSEGAGLISIDSDGDSYKVAACTKHGCRIAVSEFGTKANKGDYRHDSKFTWLSDTVFETTINGNRVRFYHCLTK